MYTLQTHSNAYNVERTLDVTEFGVLYLQTNSLTNISHFVKYLWLY